MVVLAMACRSRLGTHTLQALEAVVAQQQGEPASGGKGGEGGKRLQLHGEAAELLEQALALTLTLALILTLTLARQRTPSC